MAVYTSLNNEQLSDFLKLGRKNFEKMPVICALPFSKTRILCENNAVTSEPNKTCNIRISETLRTVRWALMIISTNMTLNNTETIL